jgi:hypothetical protein
VSDELPVATSEVKDADHFLAGPVAELRIDDGGNVLMRD